MRLLLATSWALSCRTSLCVRGVELRARVRFKLLYNGPDPERFSLHGIFFSTCRNLFQIEGMVICMYDIVNR